MVVFGEGAVAGAVVDAAEGASARALAAQEDAAAGAEVPVLDEVVAAIGALAFAEQHLAARRDLEEIAAAAVAAVLRLVEARRRHRDPLRALHAEPARLQVEPGGGRQRRRERIDAADPA